MHWPYRSISQGYNDYFLTVWNMFFQRRKKLGAIKDSATRLVTTTINALKQPMMGLIIEDAFEVKARSMPCRSILPASGSISVGPLPDSLGLDALITDADCTARCVGSGWESEGIVDLLDLRSKTIVIEDNARTWPREERAV